MCARQAATRLPLVAPSLGSVCIRHHRCNFRHGMGDVLCPHGAQPLPHHSLDAICGISVPRRRQAALVVVVRRRLALVGRRKRRLIQPGEVAQKPAERRRARGALRAQPHWVEGGASLQVQNVPRERSAVPASPPSLEGRRSLGGGGRKVTEDRLRIRRPVPVQQLCHGLVRKHREEVLHMQQLVADRLQHPIRALQRALRQKVPLPRLQQPRAVQRPGLVQHAAPVAMIDPELGEVWLCLDRRRQDRVDRSVHEPSHGHAVRGHQGAQQLAVPRKRRERQDVHGLRGRRDGVQVRLPQRILERSLALPRPGPPLHVQSLLLAWLRVRVHEVDGAAPALLVQAARRVEEEADSGLARDLLSELRCRAHGPIGVGQGSTRALDDLEQVIRRGAVPRKCPRRVVVRLVRDGRMQLRAAAQGGVASKGPSSVSLATQQCYQFQPRCAVVVEVLEIWAKAPTALQARQMPPLERQLRQQIERLRQLRVQSGDEVLAKHRGLHQLPICALPQGLPAVGGSRGPREDAVQLVSQPLLAHRRQVASDVRHGVPLAGERRWAPAPLLLLLGHDHCGVEELREDDEAVVHLAVRLRHRGCTPFPDGREAHFQRAGRAAREQAHLRVEGLEEVQERIDDVASHQKDETIA
mmetsp:Transcript_108112/g.349225  ORF Transcript_108112/g.349225 Transcript_108112/m.349225 type:complete len:640 (-) Transcript_108112:256-2175(-)